MGFHAQPKSSESDLVTSQPKSLLPLLVYSIAWGVGADLGHDIEALACPAPLSFGPSLDPSAQAPLAPSLPLAFLLLFSQMLLPTTQVQLQCLTLREACSSCPA